MNERPDPKPLLDEVLAESAPPDFRAALLAETLRLARRRRRWRQARPVTGVLGLLLLTGWIALHHRLDTISGVRPMAKTQTAKSYELVETLPMRPGALVATSEFAGLKTISSETTIMLVATSAGNFRYINDAELLALAGLRPAILVRLGPGSEELVFAGTDSSKGHPTN